MLRTIDFQPRYCGSYNYNIHPIEYINHMHKIVKVFFLLILLIYDPRHLILIYDPPTKYASKKALAIFSNEEIWKVLEQKLVL